MNLNLTTYSTDDLVALYNAVAKRPVKKFDRRSVAIERAGNALAEAHDATFEDGIVIAPDGKRWDAKARTFVSADRKKHAASSPVMGKRLGIGARIADLLIAGKDTKAIVETIHAEFPQSRATGKDVSIMRSKLRNQGKLA
jgi:hypothetical protein